MPVFHHGLNDDNTLSRFSLLIIAIHITSVIILLQTFIFLKNYLKYTYNNYQELFIFTFFIKLILKKLTDAIINCVRFVFS